MESSTCSFFTAASRPSEHHLVEKLGITTQDLWQFLTTIIQNTNAAVQGFNKTQFHSINAMYNHKFSDTLHVDVIYFFKNTQVIHCLACKKLRLIKAEYTFKNPQNLLKFSLTTFDVHCLSHGNFESLKQAPVHIHRVLGIGYYSGES